ncbi:MAG: pseudouridine synthase [Pseudomonadota bacterium]|nr:pseudouridine synthase [Pseudomonadota bacterium]
MSENTEAPVEVPAQREQAGESAAVGGKPPRGPGRRRGGRGRRSRGDSPRDPQSGSAGKGADDAAGEVDDLPRFEVQATIGSGSAQARGDIAGADEDHPKLHKVLADSGMGARREMEEWIVAGRVTVNGLPAHIGQRIAPNDQIRINGRPLKRKAGPAPARVLLYHKPAGEICSRSDPGKRKTVFDRLPKVKGARWVSVGRLDFNTEGLLVFTTSGDLANKLMHPRYGWEREYAVRILGRIDEETRERLLAGVELDDGKAAFTSIDELGGDGANAWYRVVLAEGRNREVRRMFESVGLTVSRLVRVRFGPIGMPSSLTRGRWTELSVGDVGVLGRVLRDPQGPGDASSPVEAGRAVGAADDFDDMHDEDLGPEFDDDWQPTSQDAHLEGITRTVRAGEVGAPGRQRRGRRNGGPGGMFPSGPMDGLGSSKLDAPGGGNGGGNGNRAGRGGRGGRGGSGGRKAGGPGLAGVPGGQRRGGKPAGAAKRRGRRGGQPG